MYLPFIVLISGVLAAEQQPSMTPSAVAKRIEQQRQRVAALDVTYTVDMFYPARARKHPWRVREHLWIAGRSRKREVTHWDEELPESCDLNRNISYFKDDILSVYYPASRRLNVTDDDVRQQSYSLKFRFPAYLEFFGWWPPGDTSRVSQIVGRPFCLHELLEDPSCEVDRRSGMIVLSVQSDDGLDEVHLNPERGWALVSREWNGTDGSRTVWSVSKLAACGSGIWLPESGRRMTWRNVQDDVDRPPDAETVVAVEQVRLNSFSASSDIFVPKPPPGTLVTDYGTWATYQIEGGHDLLDELIDRARVMLPLLRKGNAEVPTATSGFATLGWLYASILVLVMLAGAGGMMRWLAGRRRTA